LYIHCPADSWTWLDGDMADENNIKKGSKGKKDAQLVLRLNKDMRDRFIDACQDLDSSAAREVRRFIKRFLKRYERGDLDDLYS
jgi:hypothetical protein